MKTICIHRGAKMARAQWQVGGTCFVQIGRPWYPSCEIWREPDQRSLRCLIDSLLSRIWPLAQQAEERSQP